MNLFLRTAEFRNSIAATLLIVVVVLGTSKATAQDAIDNATSAAAADDAAQTAELPGRIVVEATLRHTNEDGKADELQNELLSIDPNTGKWKSLTKGAHSVRVSPDGSTVAYSHGDELWICDAKSGENARRVADLDGRPVWSPDGSELILSDGKYNEKNNKPARQKPAWFVETWKVSRDGSNPTWQPVPSTDFVEDWSPDGNWLLTSSDRHPPFGSGYQLYLVSPDATSQVRLTTEPGLNVYARFSPDGERVVYLHQRGRNSIRVINIEDGKETEIVADEGLKRVDMACWAPDGKHIAVQRINWEIDKDGDTILRADSPNSDPRIEIMTLDGRERRRLTLKDVEVTWLGHPDWK